VLREAKHITQKDYDRYKTQALRWHAERAFGKDTNPEAPTSLPPPATPPGTPAKS